MRKKINYIYLFLFISIFFLIIGIYLTIDAYWGINCIEISGSQIEYIKNLPFCVDVDKKKNIPLYKENYFLKKHPFIYGFIITKNYENKSSIKQINIITKRPLNRQTGIICLIDTRSRN